MASNAHELSTPRERSYNYVRFPRPTGKSMKKRGKILRDPGASPGLLMIEGRQYRFCLEAVWTSEVPPKPGLAVDVQFDRAGQILAITAVSEPPLADKPAERFASTARAAAMTILRRVATKCGMPNVLRR